MAIFEQTTVLGDSTVLIVDDEPAGETLAAGLRAAGYPTLVIDDIVGAAELLSSGTHPATVIRTAIQGGRGLSLISDIGPPRGRAEDVAVIALGRDDAPGRIAEILDLGAVDYVAAPFAVVEAVARVASALRWRAFGPRPRLEGNERAETAPNDILGRLTTAEASVAQRASRGLTNRAIAAELFVSVKAVEFHMGHILQKLALANRTELAAVVAGSAGFGGGLRLVAGN